jgi:hypothetical protein
MASYPRSEDEDQQTPQTHESPQHPLEERLAQLEQLLSHQAERIAQQERQLARLGVLDVENDDDQAAQHGLDIDFEALQPEPQADHTDQSHTSRPGQRQSRRKLLQLGGVAVAAGIAGTLVHVKTSGGALVHAAPAPNTLACDPNNPAFQVTAGDGCATVAIQGNGWGSTGGVRGESGSGVGVWGQSDTSTGVNGKSFGGVGVWGESNTHTGVNGLSVSGVGVWGQSSDDTGVNGKSTTGVGVWGESTTSTGVNGKSAGGVGVWGESSNNTGVNGVSDTGVGAWGTSTWSTGVNGISTHGVGVYGQSTSSVGAFFVGGRAPITLGLAGATGAPTSGAHFAGDIVLDHAATVWVCIGSGTPGAWVRLPGVATGVPGGAINFLANPIRLLDTRSSGTWLAGSTHTLQVTGVSVGGISVPSGATGVIGNVTVVAPSAGGDLRLYPGATAPNTSTINFASGQVIANGVTVGLNGSGRLNIHVDMPSGTATNVLFDASGYIR